MAQMGALIDAGGTAQAGTEAVEVWAINWPALCAFLDCETQWRSAATMAGIVWLGLDYGALDIVLRRSGSDDAVFDEVRHMERAALNVFAEHG